MEETKTEKSVLYKHLSLYSDHNSSNNLSQRAIAHEIFEPFFTIGRAMRTKNMVPLKRHHIEGYIIICYKKKPYTLSSTLLFAVRELHHRIHIRQLPQI